MSIKNIPHGRGRTTEYINYGSRGLKQRCISMWAVPIIVENGSESLIIKALLDDMMEVHKHISMQILH